ncbi:quaternary ammonium compound efflux SMR transporter SugE [soil metagenome]
MAWIYVFVAGLLEIVFALSLKSSQGLTRPLWVIAFLIAASGSLFLLSQALKTLPVGAAYAVWTGIGAAGTALAGMIWFGESREILKIVSLLTILIGLTVLQLTSTTH